MNLFKNNKGMSIAEIMIAIGLAGGLSLIIMHNMKMQGKAQKTATINQNLLDLRRTLQDFLGRSEPCISSFTGTRPGEPITKLKFNSSKVYAEVGQEFLKTGLKIIDMHIMTPEEEYNYNKNESNSGIVDLGSGSGDFLYTRKSILVVKVEKMVKNATGERTFLGGTTSLIYVPFVGAYFDQIHGMASADKQQAYQSWLDAYNDKKTEIQTTLTAMNIPAALKSDLSFIWTYKTQSTSEGPYFPNPDPNLTTDDAPANDQTADGFHKTPSNKWVLVWSIGNYALDMVECGNQVSLGKSADI